MLVLYKCNLCGNSIKKLYSGVAKKANYLTCHCSGVLMAQLPEISTSSFEVVDNGNMNQKVYLRKDAKALAKNKGEEYIKKIEERDKPLKDKI
jgi:hypothetical protein